MGVGGGGVGVGVVMALVVQVLQPTPLRSLMAAVVASGVEQAAMVQAAVNSTVIAPAQAATVTGSTLR